MSDAPFTIGERIGDTYVLRRILGRGGMSRVFEADDLRLSRRVAIKVADDAELGATALALEGTALAAVRHPGVPVVYGLGEHRGCTYLVLERLYGISLDRFLATPDGPRRLGLRDGVPILAAIAEALAAMHRARVTHRDLEPGNVMLCPHDRVVLFDVGSMIPEVEASHRVDVFDFGVLAFELFAGAAPFEVSAPDLAVMRPELPSELVAMIAACLAKDPAGRPDDMDAVGRGLRALLRAPTAPRNPRAASGEVLIIEDDEDIRDGLAELLTTRGFCAHVAANGREAQELITRTGRRPAVILLDLMMPVMDGQAFLEQQSAHPILDGVPVLLVTAQPAHHAARFPSVRGIFQKPLEMPELLRRLGDVCFDNLPTLGMEALTPP